MSDPEPSGPTGNAGGGNPGRGDVVVLRDADEVATTVAFRLTEALSAIQADRRVPSVVLTGGTIARKIHRAVAELAARPADARPVVDWSRVDVWWGDERFLPGSDGERNAHQAFEDLLTRVPIDQGRVHVAPARGVGEAEAADVESAAAGYGRELGDAYGDRDDDAPWFDVLMLGIGPDGHCASLFPGRPEVHADGLVVPVRNSPKPPPERVSFTMPVLHRAREVWFVASSDEKADAVRRSVAGGAVEQTPAAGPRGRDATYWFLDQAAASAL